MASLAQVTSATRTGLKWLGILIGFYILYNILLFPVGKFAFQLIFPPKAAIPEAKFGKLPIIAFPTRTTVPQFTYTIQTTSGSLPPACTKYPCNKGQLPDRMMVYPIANLQEGLFSLDLAKQKVGSVGFRADPQQITSEIYQWKGTQDSPDAQIIFNIVTNRFDYTVPLATDSSQLTAPVPDTNEAISSAINLLSKMGLYQKDFSKADTKGVLLKLVGQTLLPATSQSDAEYIQVNIARSNIDTYPILSISPNKPLINVLVGPQSPVAANGIYEAHYAYQQYLKDEGSAYYIKSVDQAYSELQQNQAFLTSFPPTGGSIAIRNVYLAYIELADTQKYLMPVYVFEGDNAFRAFVSAVRNDFVGVNTIN